jgi:thiol-disulfide isomerase/thioredoxin
MKQVLLAAAIGLAALGCGEARRVEVGQPAPRYVATTLAGDSATTAALAGKVVLLNIWATWCAPCRQEIPFLESVYKKHAADGLEIIGVSVDARGQDAEIREFAKEFGMTYPIWRDPDERVQSLFLALGVPASYLIDRAGVLRWRRLGLVDENDSTFTRALQDALAAR